MLLPKAVWAGIEDGSVTVAFRRWRRPTVKAGGTLRSPVGLLAIDAVDVIAERDVTDADARRAGHPGRESALAALRPAEEGRQLYRIAFHPAGPDPREVLRQDVDLTDDDLADVRRRLARSDAAADAPWTTRVLTLIAEQPGVVSWELAPQVGLERDDFKRRVRRLKALGLTESLQVGYRLSPRGRVVLGALTGPSEG